MLISHNDLLILFGMPGLLFAAWAITLTLRVFTAKRASTAIYQTCEGGLSLVGQVYYAQVIEDNSKRKRTLHTVVNSIMTRVGHLNLIGDTGWILATLIDFKQSIVPRDKQVEQQLDECFHLLERRGKVGRHIVSMLDVEKVNKLGIYPFIDRYFTKVMQKDIPHLDVECNQPHRRFPHHIEEDIAITCMALLTHAAYNRIPTTLSFYLMYSQNLITLHLVDDDEDTATNLDLYHLPKENWPPCYRMADTLADLYNGYMTIDPTYTTGQHIEIKLALPSGNDGLPQV
ncbi:hypothetical protein AB9P05_07665 [Roseivirga sp. BDSF3-8]|uniref:hypothetical protein n=1 Tax=Roseivirga sp. BDSF3-8 TaxID=3241598 RepID=UPI003531C0E9